MRKELIPFVVLLILTPWITCPPVYSQTAIEISSSPNPVGSGARALGMGGAFIGVADDATAASWNPGGLCQLPTPEVSMVVNGVHRIEDNRFGDAPEAGGEQTVTETEINYFSLAYPFNIFDRNMVISLNYQNLYDFAREWDFSLKFSTHLENIGDIVSIRSVGYDQSGSLSAVGIAYCIQIIPELSFGFTLNFWEDNSTPNDWESEYHVRDDLYSPMFGPMGSYENHIYDRYEFSGFNGNVGVLWRTTPKLTTGFVFKFPFTADIHHERRSTFVNNGMVAESVNEIAEEKLDMPASYGIGFAYRFSDNLTISLDVYHTRWDDLSLTDKNGVEISPITGKLKDESHIEPTTQIRTGMEYLWIPKEKNIAVPIRFGLFYDPEPDDNNPDDYYGFSLGSGIAVGRYVLDMAYQFRYGDNVGAALIPNYTFSQDIREHMLYASMIVHF